MNAIQLQSFTPAIPKIYAYSTPEVARHQGWVKIGYTEQSVEARIKEQAHTIDVIVNTEWSGDAIYYDNLEAFTDKHFHSYLTRLNYEQEKGKNNEWFKISAEDSYTRFEDFRKNHGVIDVGETVHPYQLRDEQADFVRATAAYYHAHEHGEFLWNAKPRFGKTLATYDFCKTVGAKNVLIVTNRPAIANSWYKDYLTFFGAQSGYRFVSEANALKGEKCVLSREQFERIAQAKPDVRRIEFVSLQDLKGSIDFGGKFDKNRHLVKIAWDVLVVDEAHEGVDTRKTYLAFDQIQRRMALHLSGTPFKALANDKFAPDAIKNWTYVDERRAKRDWDSSRGENPYDPLPQLRLFTYQMADIVRDELEEGIEIDGARRQFAFDLNEFFSVVNGRFVHDSAVDRFLDALTSQVKFPFSTEELRQEVKHTLWILNRVESVKALAKKLRTHEVFCDYEVVVAAGDGRNEDDEKQIASSYKRVKDAIAKHEKTITLSVGQLTTGVTIPEWSGVLMLSNMKSESLYMQAAFRAQNPCLYKLFNKAANKLQFFRKENAYVFDFDPARTLTTFEKFANDLCSDTSDGRGDAGTRKDHVKELLNFFPVIGEAEGEMVELSAEEVLSIPRKIRSVEVVRSGFMNNFLFQNVASVFGAPKAVLDLIQRFEPVDKAAAKEAVSVNDTDAIKTNDEGNIVVEPEVVVGQAAEVFGPAIYKTIERAVEDAVDEVVKRGDERDNELEALKQSFCAASVRPLLNKAEASGTLDELKVSEKNRLERQLLERAEQLVEIEHGKLTITSNRIEHERQEKLAIAPQSEHACIHKAYDKKLTEAKKEWAASFEEKAAEWANKAGEKIVETKIRSQKERVKEEVEDKIKDHLRGFSRTIPSFLMAYGTEETTLENFDKIIPDAVFKELTSITTDEFRLLRDGGDYTESETGMKKHFEGHLFDEVVFNDSVKEFLRKREELANYFDESQAEDIFNFIPAQKTSLVFTPKRVVVQMADLLEKENPGCYDDSKATFIDPYMKSGMFIAEIVKRLFRSEMMKKKFPEKKARLQHIFEKQVYGCAPSEIIHKIVLRYLLGFDKGTSIKAAHIVHYDTLPAAKAGMMDAALKVLFG